MLRDIRKSNIGVAAAICAAAALPVLTATPASAATITYNVTSNCWNYSSHCSGNEVVDDPLYVNYHSVSTSGDGNPSGSFAEFYGNVSNYGSETSHSENTDYVYHYVYLSGYGDGSGQAVKNNAASANNCSTVNGYRIYFYSGYSGHSQSIPHYFSCASSTNLDSTLKNNNASQHFA
jgi:hypothetical protein